MFGPNSTSQATGATESADRALRKEAERLFRAALELSPRTPEVVNLLATTALEASMPEFAEEILREILAAFPRNADSRHLLGCALRDQANYAEAVGELRHALALRPETATYHVSLGDTLRRQGAIEESAKHCQRGVDLDPRDPQGQVMYGNAMYRLGEFEAAHAAYERALSLDPSHAHGHRNLAITHFLRGDFAEGYAHYEWRWKLRGFRGTLEELGRPMWEGEGLEGRTLLVHAEQGLGDTIQFVRYVPLIQKGGGRIVLQARQPLVRLLQSVEGVDEVVVRGSRLPEFDSHCPLLSLPRVFGTRVETIPAAVPYMRGAVRPVGRADGPLRVGVAWSGNPRHSEDRMRSIPFALFAMLFEREDAVFYRLHTRAPGETNSDAHPRLADPTEDFVDLAATAELIDTLDLVIAVDTVIAHLAGALGKRVWTLLPFAPDWRWMLQRKDSPWYPTMRLFRQPALYDWGSVIAEVRRELAGVSR